jgi:protein-S-isoprenylcysteine O-methyltransferase Ste14
MADQHDNSVRDEPAARLLSRGDVVLGFIVVGLLFLIVGESSWPNGEKEHETIEWIGLVLIIVAIFGRTWCSIYFGDQKRAALMVLGPYSVCRNPLYAFTIIGGVGVGAQVGSAIVALICGAIAWVVLQRIVRQEEAFLLGRHGEPYIRYCERVPRFIPKLSLWQDADTVEVWPQAIAATFVESALYLLAIPAAEAIEYLHDSGALPVLLVLP